jgi:hypothetical protein
MCKLALAALAALVAAGCQADVDPLIEIGHGGIAVAVGDDSSPESGPSSQITFTLTRYAPTSHDPTPDCIRIAATSTIVATSTASQTSPGTLVDAGSYDYDGPGGTLACQPPTFVIELDPRPASVAVVISDGTGTIDLGLALDANDFYSIITSCTAAACEN